jgi:ketosteroid isomerase-like protein
MTSKAAEKELVKLEREYWQALKDRDWDAALRLTADPCIVVSAGGVGEIEKKSVVEMMRKAPYTLDEFELGDIKVKMLGDDVAVVAYKAHEKMTVEGEPVTLDVADTSTWVRRRGRWVCALHTEAIQGDAYGRDRNGAKAEAAS